VSGARATAGALIFQGTADHHFNACRAGDGKPAWSITTDAGIVARAAIDGVTVRIYQPVARCARWRGLTSRDAVEQVNKAGSQT